MPAIKVQPEQSLLDISISVYGNADAAMPLLLADNYQTMRTAAPADGGAELDLAGELLAGSELLISDNPVHYDRAALRELDGAVVATTTTA